MTTAADVGWGKYSGYEGPVFLGTQRFSLPPSPTNDQRIVGVITATEGGRHDAINMYDRCIVSVGLIQWCEASYFLTSRLLGALADSDPSLLSPMSGSLSESGAEFRKDAKGRWMFHVGGDVVDERGEQTGLFFLGSDGHAGTWDDASRARAKGWAASLANVLAQPAAQDVQSAYTARRVRTFATAQAQQILWDQSPDEGLVGATRAAFLSFAANLPAVASQHLVTAASSTSAPKWGLDWCVHVLKELTFGPGIAIYPGRYNKIRPVVERGYGVDLPDFADELKAFRENLYRDCPPSSASEPGFEDPAEIQQVLIDLGYDLGPAGADGKIGQKSRDAIRAFQGTSGLAADGIVGKMTRAKLAEAWRRLHGT